jgi:hypothetical protein
MYNGYNYYSPNASATSSPVILMPYPYPYDPFFMAPNTEVPTTETDRTTNDGDDEEGGIENDGAKENNQHAEEQTTVSFFYFICLASYCVLLLKSDL